MAKSLLILMLMTTQLLAGSTGPVYICIKNNGEYCCLDTSPKFCTCCQEHRQEAAHETCCADSGCAGEIVELPCGHHDQTLPSSDLIVEMDDACGCTHIPVAVSPDQATTATRTAFSAEIERLALHVVWLPTWLSGTDTASFLPHFRWNGPPTVPDFALTVLSTAVIRC